MKKIRIGILGASDIAYRRFLPALAKSEWFDYIGVAVADWQEWGSGYEETSYQPLLQQKMKKAAKFTDGFGGRIFVGYRNLLLSGEIDAVYIPLTPGLHDRWCRRALQAGIHVFVEKPCTTDFKRTLALVRLAKEKGLAIYENYAFCLHRQMKMILDLVGAGELGQIRLIRCTFGFPHRGETDFRYQKESGGGALLDCGGYVVRAAQMFLGDGVHVCMSALHQTGKNGVDLYGSMVLADQNGREAQLAFGMDNAYRCELEIWGSRACLTAPRIFTPPADFAPVITIRGQEERRIEAEPDDQFANALDCFFACIADREKREPVTEQMLCCGRLVREAVEKNILK